jgi:hypothetical protein
MGDKKSLTYQSWHNMKQRCHNAKNPRYPQYGARGIQVCEHWRNNFTQFFADMGTRPSKKHSLGRIDNDGDYTPENCQWGTARQQQNNMRSNKRYLYKDQWMTIAELSRISAVNYDTLWERLHDGMPVHDAVESPLLLDRSRSKKLITINDITHTVKEWRTMHHISPSLLSWRLRKGQSLETALAVVPR